MKTKIKYSVCFFIASLIVVNVGCKRQDDWLDQKINKASVTPQTINDYQALLDNYIAIHNNFSIVGLIGADNIYMVDADYSSSAETDRNAYLWAKTIWTSTTTDWSTMYGIMEYANIVIDGMGKLGNTNTVNYNDVLGQAYFYRAISLYNLAELFCGPYNPKGTNDGLGLPVRVSSDVNIIYQRSTINQTYLQMVSDAKKAIDLVLTSPISNRRPSKAAANALLAKIYLSMEDYANARSYADASLKLNSTLLDFNNTALVSLTPTYRFPANGIGNPEILFYAQGSNYPEVMPATASKGNIVPDLYNSYKDNDLRKSLFYAVTGTVAKFRGAFTGLNCSFCGIANNEVYLIRAECAARLNDPSSAMSDLNTLLRSRYKSGTYVNFNSTDQTEALKLILTERRKELPFVGNLRWEDLRRLNKDPNFATTISRTVSGKIYSLLPNSSAYIFPIPDNEIQLSGITQNLR